jgi:hypothetical protein
MLAGSMLERGGRIIQSGTSAHHVDQQAPSDAEIGEKWLVAVKVHRVRQLVFPSFDQPVRTRTPQRVKDVLP